MLVKFNSVRVLGFQERLIIPGINDLPEAMVADLMDDSIHAAKFDSGELEVVDKEQIGAVKVKTEKKGKPPTGVDVLLAASEKNAVKLASETVDTAILKVWNKREDRPSVKAAIKAQWNKIKNVKFRDEKDKTKFESKEEA